MDMLPPPCAGGCGRPVRPHGATPDMYPNTRTWRIKARGMCLACHTKAPRLNHAAPRECLDCKTPLRVRGSAPAEGTKVHDSNGLCMACRGRRRRGTNGQPARSAPVACVSCEHPLRPRHSSKDEHPDTKEHAGKGLCRGCESAVRKNRLDPTTLPPPVYAEPAPRDTAPKPVTDPVALRFHAERKARHEREQRSQQLRAAQEAARARFIQTRRNAA